MSMSEWNQIALQEHNFKYPQTLKQQLREVYQALELRQNNRGSRSYSGTDQTFGLKYYLHISIS